VKTATDAGQATTRELAGQDSTIERRPAGHGQRSPSPLATRICWASVAITILPLIVATIRALQRGWIPIGDNAYFELRSRDVFSHHFPLLGTWTSASQTADVNFNNPGPLFFDLLALPVKLFNSPGLAIGVLLLNSAAIVGIAAVAYRRGGPVAGTVAMAMTAGLTWTMGSELLFDPWQPHAMLLPFLFFVVLVWSLACGDLVLLPVAVGVASLVLETHLSYAVLVPVLAIWGTGALAWTIWNRRRRDPDGWPELRQRVWRTSLVSAVVFVVLWGPPLIEEARHGSDGNLSRLLSSVGKAQQTVGWTFGSRLVASIVSLPPWWMRPSFGDAFVPKTSGLPLPGVQPDVALLPSLAAALVSLLLALALLGVLLWDARRRADRTASAALATALVAIGGALVTAGTLPRSFFGIAPHQFRWLWPISLFVLFAALLAIARRVQRLRAITISSLFAVAAVLLAVLNLPRYNQSSGPSVDEAAIPAARDMLSQLGSLDGKQTLLFDTRGLRFGEPWDAALVNGLERRGHKIVVNDPVMIRQLGPARAFDGHADGRLVIAEGEGGIRDHPGMSRAVLHVDLDAAEQSARLALQQQIGDMLASGGLRLNAEGSRAADSGKLAALVQPPNGARPDPRGLVAGDQIRDMLINRWIDLDPAWKPLFARYADLQHRWNFQTVAVFVGPVGSS
jgi:hypothetical protein